MKVATKLFGTVSLLFVMFALIAPTASAQIEIDGKTAVGTWKTIDDESGKAKSHVTIYEKGGKFYGKIIKLLHVDPEIMKKHPGKEYSDLTCEECPSDHGKDKKLEGLEIVWDMEKYSNKWGGGSIMDPKKGKIYTCTMWLEDADTLKVRGWLAFFYRTQTWYRVK